MTSDFDRMLTRASHLALEHMDWRTGQCLFAALYEIHPARADEIQGTYLDPFYFDSFTDEAVVLFLAWAEDLFDKTDNEN